MGRKARDLRGLYDEAERNETCLVAFTQGERQLLARHAVQDGLVCPLPGLYVRKETWHGLDQNARALWAMRGLAAIHPTWTFAGASAALAYGLRVPFSASKEIQVVGKYRRGTLDDSDLPSSVQAAESIAVRFNLVPRHLFAALEPRKVDGILVTSPCQTILSCLSNLDFSDGLVVADSYLATFSLTSERLVDQLGRCQALGRDIEGALTTAGYADPRAESGGESYARARMIVNGYEVPDLQVDFVDPMDGSHMRADFVWRDTPGGTIVGEFDGFEKYRNPGMTKGRGVDELLVRQNLRDTRLNLLCDRIFHFCYEDVRYDHRLCRIMDCYGIPRVHE